MLTKDAIDYCTGANFRPRLLIMKRFAASNFPFAAQ
jgi:hypothetical protein